MITDWLQRRRLVRKGLACDKTRLSHSDDTLQSRADSNWKIRLLVLGFFIALLHLGVAWGRWGGSLEDQILAFIVFISGLMLLELDCPEVWRSNSRLVLILGAVWVNLLVVKAIYVKGIDLGWFVPNDPASMGQFYFCSPCTFAPFLITLLLGTRIGLFSVVQVSMLASLLIDRSFTFLLISLLSGFTAVYFTRNVRKRFDLIKAGFAVGTLNLICATVLGLVHGRAMDSLGWQAFLGICVVILTAFVVSGILPAVEWMFEITTTISWLEMADLNHPLLQQMTMEAPGSYHHSLLVANLAESGAKAIGLDATACRVMAYFHDVGKIIKPEYFTENIPPGANPHENLTPSMSALIIIAHVKEGIDLALKYRLKKQVLDAIQQHHGDSVVTYFHQRALQQQQDAREGGKIMNMREEDVPNVSENSFRYPGPKPQTKEIGLLSIADAVEAASRSLEKPTAQRIEDLVNEIVEDKISTGQLDESNLTMNEIRAAAEAMSVTLKNMMHTRISYAKKEKQNASTLVKPAKRNAGPGPSASAAA
ncbi:MAG TPA: HDIG domain-containing protein [Candidatus Methylacidiphilales bacterium]|jgi:putative nucleotidyltransferase with HDIG domain|nr:HDIG domain-containing protein [Candidatus Methylacidiphilales bacterium]